MFVFVFSIRGMLALFIRYLEPAAVAGTTALAAGGDFRPSLCLNRHKRDGICSVSVLKIVLQKRNNPETL